ncbi:hypothetical protein [Catellatospora vulcania]|uniref:hypothetical protein n=1 Tax=Catellatospora vulcania TaxID=1460450 RepID=UPI0012D488F2|nr:hypothetical protein [Catellatospora vulcania]
MKLKAPCRGEPTLRLAAKATESVTAVTVGLYVAEIVPATATTTGDDCFRDFEQLAEPYQVRLNAPLGNRGLVGASGASAVTRG